ncbi:Flap endonuclease 1 [Taenia crassiceps]|uniref:Flap endonuclease 1 n=1 Tax=Taenia crassiceps TaxID=6207 RepID=A0ABR4QA20_9CEST
MGIHQLTKVVGDYAPKAIKNGEIKSYFGRKVAIDASLCLYQFLVAVRSEGNNLANEAGESTSHLMGMFYRTIRMLEGGLKPVYVFEGKPPRLKSGELAKRTERREENAKELGKAKEVGDVEAIEKYSRRLVKITSQHSEDCKTLLRLMGVPFVEAPGEAEAQCAALAKSGKVFAVGTEDMDALAFGAPVLLRHLTFSEARKMPVQEFNLQKILDSMDLTMNQFVHLCVMLGCDYCESIKGIGPKKSVELIQRYKSLESILEHIDTKKYQPPEGWVYKEAVRLFVEPDVIDPATIELRWTEPNEDGIVEFMCAKNGFNEERIRNGVKKIQKSRTISTQGRIDNFFQVKPAPPSDKKKEGNINKRLSATSAKKPNSKKRK